MVYIGRTENTMETAIGFRVLGFENISYTEYIGIIFPHLPAVSLPASKHLISSLMRLLCCCLESVVSSGAALHRGPGLWQRA